MRNCTSLLTVKKFCLLKMWTFSTYLLAECQMMYKKIGYAIIIAKGELFYVQVKCIIFSFEYIILQGRQNIMELDVLQSNAHYVGPYTEIKKLQFEKDNKLKEKGSMQLSSSISASYPREGKKFLKV